MPRGGSRIGAGRKSGGANKRTREVADKVAVSGLTPLEFMIAVMIDERNDLGIRMDAAKNAARYVHPSLTAITHSGKIGTDFDLMDVHQIQAWIAQRAAALFPAPGRDEGETAH
jgi:hypothetical protein